MDCKVFNKYNNYSIKITHDLSLFDLKSSSPVYKSLFRKKAELCFLQNKEKDGIYCLSESMGVGLQQDSVLKRAFQSDYNVILSKRNDRVDFPQKHLSLKNKYALDGYDRLLHCLKEMPEEWTLIQITQPYCSTERWTPRFRKSVTSLSQLHLVKYSCGENCLAPCHILISKPHNSDGTGLNNIFELVCETNSAKSDLQTVKQKREEMSQKLKTVSKELISSWFKEWSSLLCGKLVNNEFHQLITNSLNTIFERHKSKRFTISEHKQSLIHHIANGCCYISKEQVALSVSRVVPAPSDLRDDLIKFISSLRSNELLSVQKRHPVILILDEKLECIPWEMTLPLENHPVCRLLSVQFTYELYRKHQSTVKKGNSLLKYKNNRGYYIINPSVDLKKTENRIISFVHKKCKNWNGIVGRKPTEEEYVNALTRSDVFLYCGHGSGMQYFKGNMFSLDISTFPLLCGCCSVKNIDVGGRINFRGVHYNYISNGCVCVFGTIWNVTANDLDSATLSLLNNWLPNSSVGNDDAGHSNDSDKKEPEFLRAIILAKNSITYYANCASLVTWGLPLAIEN